MWFADGSVTLVIPARNVDPTCTPSPNAPLNIIGR
jgi:hypothetical protein